MTQQEAYIEGFCKAAEAMGVDPDALYKQAAGGKSPEDLNELGGALRRL